MNPDHDQETVLEQLLDQIMLKVGLYQPIVKLKTRKLEVILSEIEIKLRKRKKMVLMKLTMEEIQLFQKNTRKVKKYPKREFQEEFCNFW